jgi:DNA-binding NtrC family response regulator
MTTEPASVLVVDRESEAVKSLVARLRADGHPVAWARDGESALNALDGAPPEAVVCALRAPRIDGLAVLRRALERDPAACVVLVADGPFDAAAADAMRRGAHDVLERPVRPARLAAALARGAERRRLLERVAHLEARLDERFGPARIEARSRAMRRVVEQIRHLGPSRAAVAIAGEPGSGRTLVAQAIHQAGPRRDGPFVVLDCGAVPADLLAGELFGREVAGGPPRRGALETADGGTLLLVDVAALPAGAQMQMLHMLQTRSVERVGGAVARRADVRLVVAGERDLDAEVAAGRLRQDLDERLGAVRVRVPPLRERREDIPPLVARFIREANASRHRRVSGISNGALERLVRHDWPGNVRELRAVVDDMVEQASGRRRLDLSDLPVALRRGGGGALEVAVGMTADEAGRHLLMATLEHAAGDKTRAARMLGIGLRTLYRRLERYGLARSRPRARPPA